MSWNFIISFAVAVGVYLIVVLCIGFIKKRKKNKQKNNDAINKDDLIK